MVCLGRENRCDANELAQPWPPLARLVKRTRKNEAHPNSSLFTWLIILKVMSYTVNASASLLPQLLVYSAFSSADLPLVFVLPSLNCPFNKWIRNKLLADSECRHTVWHLLCSSNADVQKSLVYWAGIGLWQGNLVVKGDVFGPWTM